MKLDIIRSRQKPDDGADRIKEKIRLPRTVIAIYAIAALCVPLYLSFLFSERFSDFFNRYVSSALRAIYAHLTSWIPFSLAEFIIILLPVWIVLVSVLVMRRFGDTAKELLSAVLCICSLLGVIFSTFTLGFAPAYRGTTLDQKLSLERCDVSAQELYLTANRLSVLIEQASEQVCFGEDGFSVMPYGYGEMNQKLLDAYSSLSEKHSFIPKLQSRIKPVMLSDALSYTHITGMYTFFTGEVNLNVTFPDYTLPFTAAHELAHQRGIARENEANFMAFLACIESDDPYINYCAYVNMYEYVSSALYKADPDLYYRSYASLPFTVKQEFSAYSAFYEKYRDSAASTISGAVNDTFLKLHGTEGTQSYGMVVDLAVAYFKDK